MDWERVNVWTSTFYTLLHSLTLAKRIDFGNLALLHDYAQETSGWSAVDCSYNSALLAHNGGDYRITFRRDPNNHFRAISAQLTRMLVQDLATILDEMLHEVLTARGEQPANFPQSKLDQLKKHLDPKYPWAYQGCLELLACRNTFVHSGGRWNAQSIAIISPFVIPPPNVGDELILSVTMLFRFRKAMRTFLNETSKDLLTPSPRRSRKPSKAAIRKKAKLKEKRELRAKRKAMVVARLAQ